uniref:CR021 protein n=1 Tax=Salvator merianae TaxID=96440 RepID=A0A8D0DR62_SALMN
MRKHQFLEVAARQLANTCPAQARFLLWTLSNTEEKNQAHIGQVCSYCFQFLHPGNYRVRLMPKMKVTPQIEKLLIRERKNYQLSLKQTKLLKKYKESKNVLLITCHLCKKTTRCHGQSREHLKSKLSALETFVNKATPVTPCHSGSKTRWPSSCSRTSSGQSTPQSSSKTPKNAKSHVTRLKRLLDLEDSKKNYKGDLKNFLMSL